MQDDKAGSDTTAWDDDEWKAFYEERAAIREYDAGMNRNLAETMAWRDFLAHWQILNNASLGDAIIARRRIFER